MVGVETEGVGPEVTEEGMSDKFEDKVLKIVGVGDWICGGGEITGGVSGSPHVPSACILRSLALKASAWL